MSSGNTPIRRVAKALLAPFRRTALYQRIQASSMARDIRAGRFSEPEAALVPLGIAAGETAIDLGANYGMYCYHLSRAVGARGVVHAFEPIPFTFGALSRVCKALRLDNVRLHAYGVAEKPGRARFTVPLQPMGQFMAGQAYIGSRNDDHAGSEEQVRWRKTTTVDAELVALDSFVPDIVDLSFIKADIEGAETFALRGAARLIERFTPTILIEINPWFLDGFGVTLDDLTGPLRRAGYRLFRWQEDEARLREVADADIVEANYVFIHPRYASRFSSVLADGVRWNTAGD